MAPGSDEARFRAVVETAVNGVILIDARGTVLVFNPACERLFGYRADEVIGRNVRMLMPPPYQGEHDAYLDNYRRTGQRKIIGIGREVIGQRKDGSTFPMDLSVGEAKQDDGEVTFVGIIHDLTERKLAEGRRARLAAIVDSTSDAIIGMDLEGTITSWNRGAGDIYGWTATEIVGRLAVALEAPEHRRDLEHNLERLRRGDEVARYETTGRRKDGTDVEVSVTMSPTRNERGEVIGFSKIARDVTELRRAERRVQELTAELVHTARLSAMGQLSSSLAHELNQPLTAVLNYAEAARHMLANAPEAPPKVAEFLEKAASQAERAGQIMRRLRRFVEKGPSEQSAESLNQVVEEASALATTGARLDGIDVELALAPDLPPVHIDKIQIQQVVVNLVRNAVEALRQTRQRRLVIRTAAHDGHHLEVAIADTGPGIPEEIARDLFKPFVTTKKEGMGIGLSISQSIVESHEGRLWAEPNPGGGTVFRFILPRAPEEDRSPAA